jgi:hypothetical protein
MKIRKSGTGGGPEVVTRKYAPNSRAEMREIQLKKALKTCNVNPKAFSRRAFHTDVLGINFEELG